MNRGLRTLFTLGVLAGLCLVAACGGDDDSATGGKTKVTYALGFAPNYVQAYFFVALENGYYDEAGLDVEFVVPDSTQTAAKLVGVGRADVGEFLGTDPIAAVAEGTPIKVASTWEPTGDIGLMALPDKVQRVEQLKGETIGIFASLVYDDVCRARYLEANGLSEDDVETVDIGFNSVPPLLTGKVAASEGGRTGEGVTVELENDGALRYFSYNDVCPAIPIGTIINDEWGQENAEAAKAFIEATIRGVKFYVEQTEAAREIFTERFADLKDPLLKYKAVAETFCPADHAEAGLGRNSREQWEQLIEVMEEGDAIDEPLTYEDVVTDDYLPAEPIKSSACS
jgi:ABC-type nitrate/sulfonate/bicarbonate transport system substrate-binding protein